MGIGTPTDGFYIVRESTSVQVTGNAGIIDTMHLMLGDSIQVKDGTGYIKARWTLPFEMQRLYSSGEVERL